MSTVLKHFAKDNEALEILKDPNGLKEVLYLLQEATDSFMDETGRLLDDPRMSAQEKAEEALSIAKIIIETEKRIRETELYNIIALKSRNLRFIADL